MAQIDTGFITSTFDNAVTIVEDVQDKIWDISPTETPFGSAIGSNAAHATLHEWIEDTLSTPGFQAIPQGSNAQDNAEHVGTRNTNNTQIFRGVVTVSETMQAVSQYGIKKMASYLAAKRTKEVKRDIEYTFLNAQSAQAGQRDDPAETTDDATAATLMNSAQSYIDAANTTAATGAFTEDKLLATMETVYTAGGNPHMLLVAPPVANTVAAFATSIGTGISRQLVNDVSQLTAVIDVIRTPFGTLNVALDRFTKATDVFVLDTSYWFKSILRPSSLQPLAKTGSSVRMMVETELTLQGSAVKSSGLLSGIT